MQMTSSDGLGPSLLERARRSASYRSQRLMRRVREGREAPRSPEAFATHVPILAGLAARFRVERVLELGAGSFSTAVFLDSAVFPSLAHLDSIETDTEWARIVAERAGGDPRLTLRTTDEPVAQLVRALDLTGYDLILVDDSASLHQRRATVEAVAATVPPGPLVVIHDFEVDAYREASAVMDHRVVFRRFTPQTAVAWQGDPDRGGQLRSLTESIDRASGSPLVTDGAMWARILGSSGR